MNGEFDRATAVRDEGGGSYAAAVTPGWDIGGSANGGYLLSICGRAMSAVVGRPPLTVTGHFLARAPAGPCTVDVDVVREGRRMATANATLRQDGRDVLRVLGTFGHQTEDGPAMIEGAPPDLPPYDECVVPRAPTDDFAPTLFERLAVRLRPGDDGFRLGTPTGRAEIAGWFAFADEQPIDAVALLFVADAFPPPVFNTTLPVGWVPTLELTVHVRGVPAPGPLRCIYRSRFIQGGLLDEDAEMWDSHGVLVAQSRQISLTPRG
ncbi:MAG: thioesterase family protein [Ilumatobacteraceae bacterium]